jgi:hypothetical protein
MRGRLCFCCWPLIYFTTDCTRSTVKFWFLPLDIFPLSFSRHRRLVRFALVRFSICSGPICPCPLFNLHWSGLPLSIRATRLDLSGLVRFALVRFSIRSGPICPCPLFNLHWSDLPLSVRAARLDLFSFPKGEDLSVLPKAEVSYPVLRKRERSLHTCAQDVQITRIVTIW